MRGQAETLDQLRRDRGQQSARRRRPADQGPRDGRSATRRARRARPAHRGARHRRRSSTRSPRRRVSSGSRLEIREHELEGRWLGAQLADAQAELGLKSTEELTALDVGAPGPASSSVPRTWRSASRSQIAAMSSEIDQIGRTQSRIRALQLEREDDLRTESDLTQTLADVQRAAAGRRPEPDARRAVPRGAAPPAHARRQALPPCATIERELAQSRLRQHHAARAAARHARSPTPATARRPPLQAASRASQYQITTALVHSEESLDRPAAPDGDARCAPWSALVDQLDQILRETLLWWPSHLPVSLAWACAFRTRCMALLDPTAWHQIRAAFIEVTLGSPAASCCCTLLRRRAALSRRPQHGRHLRSLAEKTQHRFTDNIGLPSRPWAGACCACCRCPCCS